ncbi:hypothetical protein ACHWQZ_G017806 [Mnemiopsis leidyi]
MKHGLTSYEMTSQSRGPDALSNGLSPSMRQLQPISRKRARLDGKLLLEDRNHNSVCMIAMNDFRKRNLLCDFVIHAGEREIFAHKIILISTSLCFAGLLDSGGKFSEVNKYKVDLDGDVVENLIDFTYTGTIELTLVEVQAMLVAAHQLKFITVIRACIDFLKRHMSAMTCISLRQFSKTIQCDELKLSADLYILQHFREVSNTDDFCKLAYSQVWELISSDNLQAESEDLVFEAVMTWVKYDVPNRRSYLQSLFSAIRLPLIPIRYLLQKVETEELITSDVNCNSLLHKAKNYHLLPDNRGQFVIPGPLQNPGRSRLVSNVLYAVGGEELNGARLRSVECYSTETKEWIPVANLNTERSGAAVAFLQGYLYACGGFEQSSALSSVERYDIYNNRWSYLPPMIKERSCAGATVLDNCLYVAGGNSSSTTLNSVERFDPRDNGWSAVGNMQFPRNGVTVCQCKNMVYAIGGHDGHQELKCVERYNIRMNKWESVCSMHSHRSYAVAGVVGGEIIVVGGYNGSINLATVEKYNPVNDSWSMLSMLGSPRSYAGCGVVDDNLFVVGGCDVTQCLNTVEMYDSASNKWSPSERINVPRACCGVSGLYFSS